jgi:excisionase family DNA binding protein
MRADIVLTSEAARLCGVSADTIRLWARRGHLPSTRTERGVRIFERRDVERLARERDQSSKPTPEGTGHAR